MGQFAHLHLSDVEWEQVWYLVVLLYPYFTWTKALSATSALTIHKARTVYKSLFEHLESAEGKLLRRTSPWKRLLADSVVAARQKLAEYYSMTDGARGNIYKWATILNPTQRL
jgi:hypothetical protein